MAINPLPAKKMMKEFSARFLALVAKKHLKNQNLTLAEGSLIHTSMQGAVAAKKAEVEVDFSAKTRTINLTTCGKWVRLHPFFNPAPYALIFVLA